MDVFYNLHLSTLENVKNLMDTAFNSFASKIDPQDTKHKIQLQLSQSET